MAGLASLQARRTRHGMCRTVSLLRTDESTCVVFPFSVTYVRRWWRGAILPFFLLFLSRSVDPNSHTSRWVQRFLWSPLASHPCLLPAALRCAARSLLLSGLSASPDREMSQPHRSFVERVMAPVKADARTSDMLWRRCAAAAGAAACRLHWRA